jgi:hypothetical protein
LRGEEPEERIRGRIGKIKLAFCGLFLFLWILKKLKFIGKSETKNIYQIKSLSNNLQLIIFTLDIIIIIGFLDKTATIRVCMDDFVRGIKQLVASIL